MKKPFYNFLKRKEEQSPGLLAHDVPYIAGTATVSATVIGALSLKYGTNLNTVLAGITALGGAYTEWLSRQVVAAIKPPKLTATVNEPKPKHMRWDKIRPYIFNIAGGTLLAELAQVPATYEPILNGGASAPMQWGIIGAVGCSVVAMLPATEDVVSRRQEHADPLTEGGVSDTIDQL